ncbi:MAG: hypothetical protein U0Z44_01870 [Kouleothrix sp.]
MAADPSRLDLLLSQELLVDQLIRASLALALQQVPSSWASVSASAGPVAL